MQVDAVEHVGAELNAIADGAEGRRAFEHTHPLPMTCERQRGREPAQPAADDEDEDGMVARQDVLGQQ